MPRTSETVRSADTLYPARLSNHMEKAEAEEIPPASPEPRTAPVSLIVTHDGDEPWVSKYDGSVARSTSTTRSCMSNADDEVLVEPRSNR